ncbi:MAG TPA: RsmE family RNA methyltransferase [Acidimicrobiales bacterium]
MSRGDAAAGGTGEPGAPDPVLVAAAAMVFVDDPEAPVVDSADLRHLLDVLRLRAGELVAVSDGAGRWVPCRVAADSPLQGSRRAEPGGVLVPDGPVMVTARLTPEVTVAFAPTKGDRPEWVTQKLTELGVDRIVPLRTSRSVVRWEGERGTKAVERLRRVAREAAAQCRRPWLPEVTDVCRLDEVAGLARSPMTLADAGGAAPGLDRPVLAVGPEGGWDDAERAAFGPPVGLGPTVLRAETAAVVAGTLLCGLRSGVVLPLA